MSKASEILNSSRKIVLKIGSNVLSAPEGGIETRTVDSIASQVNLLRRQGKQLIIVSSGAEISGVSAINLKSRHGDTIYKQAMCAIGQVELMMAYKRSFSVYDTVVGQILLTRDNFNDVNSTLHIRNTLFTLVDEGVVPIINENDSVSVEEMHFGDNDALAALTANLWNADLLILMSDIDGLYDKSPKDYPDAVRISEVDDIAALMERVDVSGKSSFGTGGMQSKIDAALAVERFATPMLLVNGKCEDVLSRVAEGQDEGTIFFTRA
jgi:glutamate 5-kinase